MGTYKPRIADSVLARKLAGKGAVLIEGPKWCGKTTTAEQQAGSVIYMDDPKKVKENLLKADLAPQELLEGEHPRLLDEWQIAPQLWDTIRFDVDHRPGNGHYILTGSSVPVEEEEDEEKQEENKKMRHSGTGRYGWVKMRPMALYESGESNGAISLKELFNAPEKIYAKSSLSREDLAFVLCRGGWPAAIDLERDIALDQAFDYVDSVVKKDMNRVVDKVRRNPERVRQLMRSYARNLASQAPYETIAADMQANEPKGMDAETVSAYIDALRKLFVVEESKAWNPNLRSKTAIRTTNTRYYSDPSIGTAPWALAPETCCRISTLSAFTLRDWPCETSGPMRPACWEKSITIAILKDWNVMPSSICVTAATASSRSRLAERASSTKVHRRSSSSGTRLTLPR